MEIRNAEERDIPELEKLLAQVLAIHAEGRSDLFRKGTVKYGEQELLAMLSDDHTPIFVVCDEDGIVRGYAMCVIQEPVKSANMVPVKTLFIDDLCVDAACRGAGYGKALFRYVKKFAEAIGAYHVTLNVWALNPDAIQFYMAMGMKPMKYVMEAVLEETDSEVICRQQEADCVRNELATEQKKIQR